MAGEPSGDGGHAAREQGAVADAVGSVGDLDRSTIETIVQLLIGVTLLAIAIWGSRNSVLVLWLVPIALAVLALDPPRRREERAG